jgi:hypothetical protein
VNSTFSLLLQDIVCDILDKCDGNMLAVDIISGALVKRRTLTGWQQVAKEFTTRLTTYHLSGDLKRCQPVFSAVQAVIGGLQAAEADLDSQVAAKAFHMLQHLQSRLVLFVPMLQLLWDWVYPDLKGHEIEVLLERLVQASLLLEQVRRDT